MCHSLVLYRDLIKAIFHARDHRKTPSGSTQTIPMDGAFLGDVVRLYLFELHVRNGAITTRITPDT
jgi:hypothetical protein